MDVKELVGKKNEKSLSVSLTKLIKYFNLLKNKIIFTSRSGIEFAQSKSTSMFQMDRNFIPYRFFASQTLSHLNVKSASRLQTGKTLTMYKLKKIMRIILIGLSRSRIHRGIRFSYNFGMIFSRVTRDIIYVLGV